MNITTHFNTANSNTVNLRNKKPSFKGNINGIILADDAEKALNKLSSAMEKVIGHEIHDAAVKIGKKNAIYSKYSDSFEINLNDNSSLSIVTDHKKIHSIFGVEKTKNKENNKVIRSFFVYNGCEAAENPIPSIDYNECTLFPNKFNMDKHTYQTGEKMPKEISALLTNLINSITKNLGI